LFPASCSGIDEQVNLTFRKWESKVFDELAYTEPFYIKDFFSPAFIAKKQ